MADTWTPISGYTPQDYTDTAVFAVDPDTKKIALITGQALVAGEENAQYIKFILDRYWDGIDIKDKAFYVEYALAGTYYGKTAVVNAEYNDEKVRFGWVVPKEACCISGTLLFVLRIESTDYVLKTQIAEHPVFKSVNVEDVVPEPTKEAWYRDFEARVETAIDDAETALTAAQAAQTAAENAALNAQTSEENAETAAAMAQTRYGSPLTAAEADEMIEQNRVYVYVGNETGYTYGHWYYYNGTEWADGGAYNGSAVNTDTTLTQSGMAADAKATGDAIDQIKEDFTAMFNSAYATDSASGSVAHFTDGADSIPMKSLKVAIEPVQSGSGDPSPDNVRPISGFNSVKVTRNGRNFCKCIVTAARTNLNGLTATPNGDGSITINGTATATTILYFNLAVENGANSASQANGTKNLRSGTYRFKELPSGIYLQIYGSDMPNAGTSDARLIKEGRRGSFTVDDTYQYNWIRLLAEKDTTFNNVVIYPAIYLASDTDDAYEPYTGETYEVSLASAGTVYGGTLDVMSGVLTVDWKMVTIDGSNYALSVLSNVYNNRYCYRNTYLGGIIEKNLPSEITKACCNILKSITRSDATSASSGIFQYHGDNDELRFLFPLEDAYSTPDKIYALGLECCIPLATPLTYQLSATEIKSLLGINNVWSDAGDVDVEYRADTKLYIKRLTGSDTDMVADANITSGQYFMVGNDLYKATVNIASGAQIVVGTNATKVSLSEALNQIKEA